MVDCWDVMDEVYAERQHQENKGWTPEHDDTHTWSDWRDLIIMQLTDPRLAGKKVSLVRAAAIAVAALESHDRRMRHV